MEDYKYFKGKKVGVCLSRSTVGLEGILIGHRYIDSEFSGNSEYLSDSQSYGGNDDYGDGLG